MYAKIYSYNIQGDDTTVATIKVIKPKVATLFSGSPSDKAQDHYVVEKLERVKDKTEIDFLYAEDGASMLARMLLEECTHIHMLVGRAINPAHQNPDFPEALSIKLNILYKSEEILTQMGKIVKIEIV